MDSDVWSELFRKVKGELSPQVKTLMTLLDEAQVDVIMLGAIRQEVLSGWRHAHQFEKIRELLRAFPDHPLTERDYELAAEYFNTCRSNGVQGSNTDFLICACSVERDIPILTKDADFERYRQFVPIKLYPNT